VPSQQTRPAAQRDSAISSVGLQSAPEEYSQVRLVQLVGLFEEGLREFLERELFADASGAEEGVNNGVERLLDFAEALGVVRVLLA
jgi:hypothetical protein